MASLQKTHFVWGSPHSEQGSEGLLAGAKVRYRVQLEVQADVGALQLTLVLYNWASDVVYNTGLPSTPLGSNSIKQVRYAGLRVLFLQFLGLP
jgi:hypothetical protein